MAFELNLTAFRHASWGGSSGLADFIRLHDDWSGASFTWAFSQGPGGPNAITLNNASEGLQGISASFEPGYLHPVSGEAVGGTIIRPQIDQTTLESVNVLSPTQNVIPLHHTLYVIPENEPRRVVCFGDFTIKQGAPSA
ncbi:hypothetical protein [Novosphingobium sp. MBES04]|uniref:hypothetical protein n=1 Tax=Novosphingobium sp. MBES04 TaxID=1206458 RepID=UPI00057DD3BD|nr:hypothetical protein [Novosphingobium sp. MBES04]